MRSKLIQSASLVFGLGTIATVSPPMLKKVVVPPVGARQTALH